MKWSYLSVAAALLLVGCGPQESLIGVWLGLNNDLEINADGTYTIKHNAQRESGKWSFDGTDITFASGGSSTACSYDKTVKNHLVLTRASNDAQGGPCKLQGTYWSLERAAKSSTTVGFACTIQQDAMRRISSPLLQFNIFNGSRPALVTADETDSIVYLHKDGVETHFVVRGDDVSGDEIRFAVRFNAETSEDIEISKKENSFSMTYSPAKCSDAGCGETVYYPIGTCVKVAGKAD